MKIAIRKISISDIEAAPNLAALLDEYASESAIQGLPPPDAKMARYKQIESACILHTFGAYLGDLLVGFITVLTSILPHYSIPISTSESFFVAKEHRKTGAGFMLLREAERFAKEVGSNGILIVAPTGSRLCAVLSGAGYRETNRVYFRGFHE